MGKKNCAFRMVQGNVSAACVLMRGLCAAVSGVASQHEKNGMLISLLVCSCMS